MSLSSNFDKINFSKDYFDTDFQPHNLKSQENHHLKTLLPKVSLRLELNES